MSQREFASWIEFFKLYPFDDVHRYHRPAVAMVGAFGGKKAADAAMDWLAPDPVPPDLSPVDAEIMRAFGVSPNALG